MSLPKLDLNITNRCNFECKHCAFNSGQESIHEMKTSQVIKILQDTKELGGKKIDITGGEPTLRDDIKMILSEAVKLDYKIELVTNASTLDKNNIKRFIDIGIDSVAISIDGHDYEKYSLIRPINTKTYDKIMDNIKIIVDEKLKLKINTVVYKNNLDDIVKINDYSISVGAYEHGLYYFTPVGRGYYSRLKTVDPKRWLDIIRKELLQKEKQIKISVEVPIIEKEFSKDVACLLNYSRSHLQILPNGNTYPCAILASYHMPIANLSSESVINIWNASDRWRKYHDRVKEVFDTFNGSCVSYDFDIKKYLAEGYVFVCPLRKFSPSELL
ncbi:MAG: radical SAM/SPASM domain-containing protein [Candidatus Woesearchaeota archaeon]